MTEMKIPLIFHLIFHLIFPHTHLMYGNREIRSKIK